ncbi:MAG: type VI secretion system contractile sheath small subunit [Proteobacteria bacterium]|nr:type VI secretion system contractile sheath small subunit [Pseudomonadota bacterium]
MKTITAPAIPKSRVNITVDVETEGSKKKKELPLKLLVLGDFIHGKNHDPLALRERISINKDNFDSVISAIHPKLEFSVNNEINAANDELPIQLEFHELKDFHPENIVSQVPQLQQLIAMRNLMKELRGNLLDKHAFRCELEKILKDPLRRKKLGMELQALTKTE